MAIKKISEFPSVDYIELGDIFLTSFNNGTSFESRKIKAENILAAGTKVLRAFISQTGASAPSLTALIKDSYADGTFTTDYVSTGEYTLSGFDNLLTASTVITINENALVYGERIVTKVTSTDEVLINTYDNTGALADGIMDIDGLFIEIITYI
jgi:hypothetical protein